jgi:hypothetical protein
MVLAKKHVPIVKKRMSPPPITRCPALRVEEEDCKIAQDEKRRLTGKT